MEAQDVNDGIKAEKSFIQLWKTIPQELKEKICDYFNFNDIMQASLVCKVLYYELGRIRNAMKKIKFRVRDDWSKHVRTMLENSPRNYTYINIYRNAGPSTTIQFFKNYPHWTRVDLEGIRFASRNEWIDYVKSFPNTLEYLKLTDIKVPYLTRTASPLDTAPVPLKALKDLLIYEDPGDIRSDISGTGYAYASYNALLALGDMPELRKLYLCCKKDYILEECSISETTIPDFFKRQKFNNLEALAVGYGGLSAEDFTVVRTGIKSFNLFGYDDSAPVLGIWNAMANKGLESISIHFLHRSKCYGFDNIVEGVFEFKQPIQSHDCLKQLILCYDKVRMPLIWYRNFFRAQSNLITLKVKWMRKDVLKSAVKMLPNLREIHYEKFYDLSEPDNDVDEELYENDESESGDEYEEIKDLDVYYGLIKTSHGHINKNVQIFKRTVRNRFAFGFRK